MKAISLWQPWATAMAIGLKHFETRHWSTSYRGPLAIHAAKRWSGEERDWAARLAEIYDAPVLANPPLGALVATGVLTRIYRTEDVLPTISATEEEFGNYGPARFAWEIKNIVALPEPISCKGAQGFFEVPDDFSAIGFEIPLPKPAAEPKPRLPDLFDFGGA